MTYSEKLKSPLWQKKRLEVLQRDDFTCVFCGNTESTLHIHHFCYDKSGNPWDVDDSALITLCEYCHTIKHSKCFTELEKYLIDDLMTHSMIDLRRRQYFAAVRNKLIEHIESLK